MRPLIHHLRAAIVLFVFVATAILATPGLDGLQASSLRSEAARAKARRTWYGWWSIAGADFNRAVRLPVVKVIEPLQRPLRIAQAWSLYGGGPGRVKRLEIEIDGVLRHRSKDPAHDWLASTLTYRKIRPIVSAICGKRSRNTDQMLQFVARRAARDFSDVREVVVRCTSSPWPGDEPEEILRYRMAAPDWQVEQ